MFIQAAITRVKKKTNVGKKLFKNQLVNGFFQRKIGDRASEIIKIYSDGKNPSDEKVAKKVNLKVTEVRMYLNKLHYWGVADYAKTRDKKTGWYSYDWYINHRRIMELLIQDQAEQLSKLEQEQNNIVDYTIFSCKKKCDQLAFEVAVQYQFKCPVCGKSMDCIDTKAKARSLKKEIQTLVVSKSELELLQQQIK